MTLRELGITGSHTIRAGRGLPIATVALGRIGDVVATQVRIEETANFIAQT